MYRDDLGSGIRFGVHEQPASETRPSAPDLAWIQVAPGAPYFVTETGEPWTPIGQNDAISWVEFEGLFRRRDLAAVEAHLRWLAAHGVTCLRLMMESAQVRHRYFERPIGTFAPHMVRLWDDLFALCERVGLRILLTPFDPFWTWMDWRHHPYNRANGGCLDGFDRVLLCADARKAIKARFTFAIERWGGSGALFAWDLWNGIHPAQAEGSADPMDGFIHDLGWHVRTLETRLYGRSHPQTASLFGPELISQPEMPLRDPIFRHPDLDFASIHIYEHGTIDHPRNTVDAAIGMGRIVRDAIAEIRDARPFLDTEHGPIHTFKDKKKTLPEVFDDEYFRHLQ
jgi:mannan endo-1,4-beta-mannosidase